MRQPHRRSETARPTIMAASTTASKHEPLTQPLYQNTDTYTSLKLV